MKRTFNLLLALLISLSLVSCNNSKSTSLNVNPSSTNVTSNYVISTEDTGNIDKIVTDLCSDKYRSRVVGTIENERATEYIETFFKNENIQPFIEDAYTCVINNGMDVVDPYVRANSDINKLHNVAAVIKGTNSDKAVFVTAHFDHVDGLEGALDNASGVSVMLEAAHKIKEATLNNPLDYDVVFVAFNAEETGLNGSIDFIKKYRDIYSDLYNINIDCVGYSKSTGLAMGCDDKGSQKLYNALIDIFDSENISYTNDIYASKDGRMYGTSDHLGFRMANFSSLTLGDNNILDVVHTCDDTIDIINFDSLESLATVVSKFIVNNNGKMF